MAAARLAPLRYEAELHLALAPQATSSSSRFNAYTQSSSQREFLTKGGPGCKCSFIHSGKCHWRPITDREHEFRHLGAGSVG